MNHQTGINDPAIKVLQDQITTESSNYLHAVVVNKDIAQAKKTKERINVLQKELNKLFSMNENYAA
jgi:NifU-like protein involved in Fe-S cluster formation